MANPGDFDHWRGGEQALLPPDSVDAGTFDYWRGGELLPVHSESGAVINPRPFEPLFIRQPIPAGIFDIQE